MRHYKSARSTESQVAEINRKSIGHCHGQLKASMFEIGSYKDYPEVDPEKCLLVVTTRSLIEGIAKIS